MITPDWTIIASAIVFLFTLWVLNRILFQPLLRILDDRDARTVKMKEKAGRTIEQESALFQNYSEKLKAEKQGGYQRVEKIRKEALLERQSLIDDARRKSDKVLAEAKEQIEGEVQAVKKTLQENAKEMAQIITARVLEKT